ncbi:hypothetical protein MA16_Dca020282 [Dendrobium catenatum]|uniref:Uncharacterized protein n=1 Tax=Dendrobium catenatum TaxID=906689 RepID=A0A2I0X472_9ASPA|nr:hypothetical protein MA16_Dca020282 [Dendrobium catenatum]
MSRLLFLQQFVLKRVTGMDMTNRWQVLVAEDDDEHGFTPYSLGGSTGNHETVFDANRSSFRDTVMVPDFGHAATGAPVLLFCRLLLVYG